MLPPSLPHSPPSLPSPSLPLTPIDVLFYDSWQVGEAVTRNIVVKNLQFHAVRVTPTPPKSNSFALKISPQTTLISAGTTFSLPVIFRPQESSDYEDSLDIATPEGNLTIALRALLPRPKLMLPSLVQLPAVVVGSTVSQIFTTSNMTRVPITWRMSVEAPFSISPLCGELLPQASMDVLVTFKPEDARVHERAIEVKTDGEQSSGPSSQQVHVVGRASYSYLALEGAAATDLPGCGWGGEDSGGG